MPDENRSLEGYIGQMVESRPQKLVISKPLRKDENFKKIIIEKKSSCYQIAKYTKQQVFHENIDEKELEGRLIELIAGNYLQVNGFEEGFEHILLISKKGACHYKKKKTALDEGGAAKVTDSHNRKKNYIIPEGRVVKPLVDMGVFTADGRIVRSMYDKYRQINRFLEILDDEIAGQKTDSLGVIDFGCGKSYLTFVVYDYLVNVKGLKVNMVGLDLKADVIARCNESAKKYGYENLHFELGDINGYKANFKVDMVLTLHACDTATDFALYNAIKWNARMIFSVPCCQHELNAQIKPYNLQILSRYGILKERFSAIATDAIRGNMLEYCGYKTQILEFIDFEHTPKNILIRAVKRPITPRALKEKMLDETRKIIDEFGFDQKLYRLIMEDGNEAD